MRLGRRPLLKMTAAALALLAVGVCYWLGLVPAALNPLGAPDLAQPRGLFTDWQLASLKRDAQRCRAVLKEPHVAAQPVADKSVEAGCGWRNAVRVSQAGGARLSADRLSCETTAALAMWLEHEVQPKAQSLLGQRVGTVQHMGTYSCRNVVGSDWLKDVRSEHATANAIDISGFTLADGRRISVSQHWASQGKEGAFLRAVHAASCGYFRVAIGPNFNKAHHDHFHFDRGLIATCR